MKKSLLLIFTLFFISSVQSQVFHPTDPNDWYLNFEPDAIEFIDLDMDGTEEVLTWFDGGFEDQYYINQNESGFFGSFIIGFGDFNEDGFLDMLSTGNSSGLSISFSDDTKTFGDSDFYSFFSNVFNSLGLTTALRATVGDFNNDGNLDIVAYQFDDDVFSVYRIYYYAGNGTGSFGDAELVGTPFNGMTYLGFESADFNDDGNEDLILSVFQSQNSLSGTYIFPGAGDGSFDLDNEILFTEVYGDLLITDIDSDGNNDLLIDGSTGVHLVENNGMTAPTVSDLGFSVVTLETGDFNNDGNADIYDANDPYDPIQLGDGNGNFSPSQKGFYPATGMEKLYLSDNDGDGTTDLFYVEEGRLYFSAGDQTNDLVEGMYRAYNVGNSNDEMNDMVSVDIDGDTHPDMLVLKNNTLEVYLNEGSNGSLTFSTSYATSENPGAIVTLDIDDDDDMDVIVGANSSDNNNLQIFLNDGSGVLGTPSNISSTPNDFLVAGDFNNDGNLDLVGAEFGTFNLNIFTNTGSGFTTPVSISATSVRQIATADYNGDGNLDLVISNGGTLFGLDGDGQGSFVFDNNNAQTLATESLTVGDVNQDGVDDIITTERGNTVFDYFYYVYFGELDATFDMLQNKASQGSFEDLPIQLKDINNDQLLDIVSTNNRTVYYAFGDGTGSFIEYTYELQIGFSSFIDDVPIVLDDIDNNGSNDFYILGEIFNDASIITLMNDFEIKAEPTTQASNLSFTNIKSDSAQVNWTRGNGDGVLVLGLSSVDGEAIPDIELPVDGSILPIVPDATFPFLDNAQVGNAFALYDGAEDSVILSALPINTEFRIAVYEYNGSGVDRNYVTTNAPVSTFTTLKGDQEVTITEPDQKEFQYEPFTPAFTINSELEATLSIVSGPATTNDDGLIELTGLGTVTYQIDQAGDNDWNALVSVQDDIEIVKGNQTINFNLNSTIFVQEDDLQLPIYTTNDLPITYTIDAGSGSLRTSGDTTFYEWDGETSLTLTATQAGNDLVNAAIPVSRSTTILKQDQTINWGISAFVNANGSQVTSLLDGQTIQFRNDTLFLNATSNAGLPVDYVITQGPGFLQGTGELSRNYIYNSNGEGTGQVTISAGAFGNDIYNTAIPVSVTFTIVKGDQNITFPQVNNLTYEEGISVTFEATAFSGLDVAYEQTTGTGIGTIDGSTISITQAGSFNIRASQTGNQNWFEASDQNMVFSVNATMQTIAIDPVADKAFGDSFDLSFTVSSGLEATVSSNTGRTSINGTTVTINAPGEETLLVTQSGNANYSFAQEMISFCISPEKPVILESGGLIFTEIIADQIEWYLDGELLTTQPPGPGRAIDPEVPGSYTAVGVVSGCADSEPSDPYVRDVRALGLENLKNVSIYPNPSSRQVFFTCEKAVSLKLYSLSGKVVKTLDSPDKQHTMDLKDLGVGQYILHVYQNGKLLGTEKLIKAN